MSPTVRYIVFVSVVSLLTGGVHYYLWTRLVRDVGLQGPLARLGTGVLIGLAAALFVGPLLARNVGGEVSRLSATVAFTWMGTLMLLMLLLGSGEFARWASGLVQRLVGSGNEETIASPERRLFFARMLGGGAAAGAFALGGTAYASAQREPKIVRVDVPLKRLPRALDGFKIVQISDLHVSATITRPYVEKVVELANRLQPDLVALTGDLMDGSVEGLANDFAPLGDLKSTHGSFAVTGNHEYYSGADGWIAHMTSLGIKTLRNEHVSIGDGDASFDLAGIDDRTAHRFGKGHGADIEAATNDRDSTRELVLLAHQPSQIHDVMGHDVGLQLSGHTHGGQIWPWGYLVRLVHPYLAGLHLHLGKTWIYVSRGTGYWGPPMRLAARHELTLLTLRSET